MGSLGRRRGLRGRVLRVRGRGRRWGFAIVAERGARAGRAGRADPAARQRAGRRWSHPLEPALGHLSFVVFVAPPRVGGDARHATIVSPGRLDRSPTGTATSARIAVLDARGDDGRGSTSPRACIDTRFVRAGRRGARRSATLDAVVPAITGRAWITGLPPARRRPDRPARGRLQAARTPGGPGASRARSTPERR